jgi:hypothetical protein
MTITIIKNIFSVSIIIALSFLHKNYLKHYIKFK